MLELKKLGDGIGLEASGVDLSRPMSDAEFRQIEQAFYAAQVPVSRSHTLTASGFLDSARRFGRPEPHVIDQFRHPEFADIRISAAPEDAMIMLVPMLGVRALIISWPDLVLFPPRLYPPGTL